MTLRANRIGSSNQWHKELLITIRNNASSVASCNLRKQPRIQCLIGGRPARQCYDLALKGFAQRQHQSLPADLEVDGCVLPFNHYSRVHAGRHGSWPRVLGTHTESLQCKFNPVQTDTTVSQHRQTPGLKQSWQTSRSERTHIRLRLTLRICRHSVMNERCMTKFAHQVSQKATHRPVPLSDPFGTSIKSLSIESTLSMGSSDRSPRGLRKVAVSATGREGGSSPGLPGVREWPLLKRPRGGPGGARRRDRARHASAGDRGAQARGRAAADTATSACFDIISRRRLASTLSLLADVRTRVQDKLRAQQTCANARARLFYPRLAA